MLKRKHHKKPCNPHQDTLSKGNTNNDQETLTMMTHKRLSSAYLIWFGVVLFYLHQYILRVSPSVMADDLMAAFQVSASGFSSLSAFALYCYALMQIPMGMLVDHYGTRRMVLSSIFLCIAGVVLFAVCEQLIVGYLARMLMGTGSACAFLSVSKIINEWFPDNRKGLIMGLTATFGTAGALLGGRPLVMLIENQGWRGSLLILAVIGLFILIVNSFTLPSAQKDTKVPGEEHASWSSLAAVFKNPQAWIFGIVAIGIYLPISVVADLWGVSFVMEKFNIDKAEAAQMISFIYIGISVGCPIFPWISKVIESVRQTLIIGAIGVIACLAYLVFGENIPIWAANTVLFGIGLSAGAEILCFVAPCASTSPAVAGTMTGFLNCIVTLAAAMIQQHVGLILDYFWDGTMASGTPVYSVHTYQIAFCVILFFTLISGVLAWFIKLPKTP